MTCHDPWPVCPRSVVGATTITTVGLGRSKPPWLHVSAVGQSICIVGSKETATWRHLLGFFSRYYLFELTGWFIYLSVWVQLLQVKGCKRNTCNIYVYLCNDVLYVCLCVFPMCIWGICILPRCISWTCHINEKHVHIYALNASSLHWLSAMFGAILPWSSPEVKLSRVWSW